MALSRRGWRIWLAVVVADVVIWLIADSQDTALLTVASS
jgi:hypothetical protein